MYDLCLLISRDWRRGFDRRMIVAIFQRDDLNLLVVLRLITLHIELGFDGRS